MAKKLVFVGGGHAHLTCISNIDEFIDLCVEVILISPSEYHYYSGMGPGLLGGIYEPHETRFHIKRITEDKGGKFIEDKVTQINPEEQLLILKSGNHLSYDLVSFNVGSFIPNENIRIKDSLIVPVKPINELLDARKKINNLGSSDNPHFCIIGGGPAGVELAGNLWRRCSELKVNCELTLVSDTKLLYKYPEKVRTYALKSLNEREVEILEEIKVKSIENNIIALENKRNFKAEMIFLATGIKPRDVYNNSTVPLSEDSALLVNEYLQSIKYPNIFGGGDCIEFQETSLDKVGVYAVKENPILFHNLKAFIQNKPLKKFGPQEKYMLILNMGNGKGILWKGNFVCKGRLAFWLKNYIDKRFVKKFQK